MKPQGTDEPTQPAPAKADEAQAPAPAQGSHELDWKGYLSKTEEQFQADPNFGAADDDPPSKRHIPTEEQPLTEDDGFTVAAPEAGAEEPEEQAGPADGAVADDLEPELEEEVEEGAVATSTEADELERRLQEKETSERELVALKGRLGKKIGDLVKTLKLHGLDENGEPLRPEMGEEERKVRQDKAIAEMMDDPDGWFDRRLGNSLGKAAEELQAIQEVQALQDAQNGGFRAFQARYKIATDPLKWAQGRDGQAWRQVLESSPRDKAAFERFMETGNKEGITLVLSDVYDRVLATRKGADVQGRKEVTRARVEKRKAPVLAGSPRPRPSSRPGVDISKPENWKRVVEIARRQGY